MQEERRGEGEAQNERHMSNDLQAEADLRLEEALTDTGARDPREFYRECLRNLKQADRRAYEEAVEYYQEVLVPSLARGVDPLPAWTEYGRRLALLTAPGRTVMVDPAGVADPYVEPAPLDRLVLHLPEARGSANRALVVALPANLTRAQRAHYELLVSGRLTLME
jgi:hypothetical protein